MSRRKGYFGISSAVVFILLEFAAAVMLYRTSPLQNIWIKRASYRTIAFVWGWSDRVRDYFSLRSTNQQLALENFELTRQLEYFRNIYPEEEKNACDGNSEAFFRYIPATIVKISRNTQHNYIIINKGSADGIFPHSGIISRDGVVGIIDAVDSHFSYGLTLMNTNVSVSARIGRSGPTASLSWDGIHGNRGILKGMPLHYETNPGDTVYTSGISDLFPGDIPVGTVRESGKIEGLAGELPVNLFQHFSTLRYVTVAINPNRAEIEALEKKEAEL